MNPDGVGGDDVDDDDDDDNWAAWATSPAQKTSREVPSILTPMTGSGVFMSLRKVFFGNMSARRGRGWVFGTRGNSGAESTGGFGPTFDTGHLLCSTETAATPSLKDRSWPSVEGLIALLAALVSLEKSEFLAFGRGEDALLPLLPLAEDCAGGGGDEAGDFVIVVWIL